MSKQSEIKRNKALNEQREALKAELARLDAEARASNKRLEDKKKIILGDLVMKKALKDKGVFETVLLILDEGLKTEDDRELFDDYLKHLHKVEPESSHDDHEEEASDHDPENVHEEESTKPVKRQRSRKSKSEQPIEQEETASEAETLQEEEIHQYS